MVARVRARATAAAIVVAGTVVAGCAPSTPAPTPSALGNDTVTIASFNFPESELLAEIYGRALERAGIDVEQATQIGSRELVQPALAAGLVEFVPEYAGTALEFLSLGERHPTAAIEPTHAELGRLATDLDVEVLPSAPAQDANAIVVTAETARRHELDTISDLVPLAPGFTFGGPPECPARPFCLQGLERVYDLAFEAFLPLESGALTRQALGRGDVNVALMFSTDPIIQIDGLVVLADDLALQPAENVTPLVRTEVIERWGDAFVERVNEVSERLTTTELRRLNAEMAVAIDAGRVADRWLDAAGIE